jgi:hypothetical protein
VRRKLFASADYDRSTFDGGDARGYTDYPAAEAVAASRVVTLH